MFTSPPATAWALTKTKSLSSLNCFMVHVFSPPVLALCSLGLCMSSSCLKQHTIHWCYHANNNNLSLQKSPSFALPYQPVKEQPIRLNVGFQLLIRSSSGIKDLSHRFLKWVTNTPSGEYMPLKVDYMKHGDRCSSIGHAAFRTTLPATTYRWFPGLWPQTLANPAIPSYWSWLSGCGCLAPSLNWNLLRQLKMVHPKITINFRKLWQQK